MKKKSRILFHICGLFIFLLLWTCPVRGEAALLPKPEDNQEIWLRRYSNMVPLSDGYMRVFHQDSQVFVEYYDDNFQIKSRNAIAMELPIWGGFYAGTDAYYLVQGQNNEAENSGVEVIRVIRYDTSWNRTGAATITSNPQLFGGEVRYPFNYGCVEMAESGGKLYLVTGHEGYVDPDVGQGHQGFLMVEIDPVSMTGKIVDCDLWHSFAQYIKSKDNNLYVLEQSEGSRYTKLSRYDTATMACTSLNVFQYGGSRTSAWALPCRATVDGMALSADQVLCVGTSIDQSLYESYTSNTPYNLYLTVTPMNDFTESATTVRQLTQYTGIEHINGVKITRVHDDRFMVSWGTSPTGADTKAEADDELSNKLVHYLFVNGRGEPISQEYTLNGSVSDCSPVVKNGRIVYYASSSHILNFYSIDSEAGQTQKVSHRVVGDNAAWDLKDGVLTISGTGPLSSSDKTTWGSVSDLATKLVIKAGITLIPKRAFSYLTALKEVEIEPGLQAIGDEAFYGCSSLEKITIPPSVTSIGENFLWTGSWWISDNSPVVTATICAPYNSYAIEYARKNRIDFYCDLSEAVISNLETSYPYTGKAIRPDITVKLGNQTLKEEIDYALSFRNNVKVGTAALTIKGIDSYYGTITKSFQIVKKQEEKEDSDQNQASAYTLDQSSLTAVLKKAPDKYAAALSIPSSVKVGNKRYKITAIGKNAFKNNKRIKTVKIPDTVVSIGSGAFQSCTSLQKVTFGKNVKTIGSQAFANCSSLRKVSLPSKVNKIGAKAFYKTKKLTQLTIRTQKLTAKSVGAKAFNGAGSSNPKKLVVKVPKNRVSAYRKLLKKTGITSKARISG